MAEILDQSGNPIRDQLGNPLLDQQGAGPSDAASLLDESGDPFLTEDGTDLEEEGATPGGSPAPGLDILAEDDTPIEDESGDPLEEESASGGSGGGGGGGGSGGGGGGGGSSIFPLRLSAELCLGGTWTDVTSYMDHGPVSAGRGHPDESVTTSAATLALTFTNTGYAFTGSNPVSPFWPWLNVNTPCRVSIPARYPYLRLEDGASAAMCPDASGLHVTGDLDVHADIRPSGCGTGAGMVIAAKACNALWLADESIGFSWMFMLAASGAPEFWWSPDGSTTHVAIGSVPVPAGRVLVRATLEVSSGTVTFFSAPPAGGTWTQLGAAVSPTGGAATTVFSQDFPLSVGYLGNSPGALVLTPGAGYTGRVYELQLYSGIGGTLVADPVFSAQASGTGAFADAQGNTWSMYGSAEISSRDYRAHVEIPEWPQDQDDTGETILVAASGGGLLRREGAVNTPVNSPMRRYYTTAAGSTGLAGYWPMEDLAGSTQFASAIGGPAMAFNGSPQLSSSTAFTGSLGIPAINGAILTAAVPRQATWPAGAVRWPMELPSGGEADNTVVAAVAVTGAAASLVVTYRTASAGSLTLKAYSPDGSLLFTTAALTGLNGVAVACEIDITPVTGGNIQYSLSVLKPGASSATGVQSSVSGNVGTVARVTINPMGAAGLMQTAVGHLAVIAGFTQLTALSQYQTPAGLWTGPLDAWLSEPAGVRFARLCTEEGIQFRGRGDLTATTAMGTQTAETLTQLLQECADADRGVWFEPREVLGWGYRTRASLYGQAAGVTASYAQDWLSPWSSNPVQDDQTILNDVTLANAGGSSTRQFAAPGQPIPGGRLSTLPPAQGGAGTYDSSPTPTVNIAWDAGLDNIASWMLHVGTVDEPRFPGIVLDIANGDLSVDDWWSIVDLDLGDRLVVNDPPPWLPPNAVSQIAQNLTEEFWAWEYSIGIAGVPESPYEVAIAGVARAGTAGSQLAAAYAYGAATMSVEVTSGSLWTTAPDEFPFPVMVAGMELTVTGIAGTSSPQAFSVTAGVNGVVKNLAAGAAVQLCPAPVAAL